MNSKNHYNFKICNNNTCVKNENVSKYNKKLNESICIPHGVKTNPTNNFEKLPNNLNFNFLV